MSLSKVIYQSGSLVVTDNDRGFYTVSGTTKQPRLLRLISGLPSITSCSWSRSAGAIVYSTATPDPMEVVSDRYRAQEVETAKMVLTAIRSYTSETADETGGRLND